MKEYENALDLVKYEKTRHAPVEILKDRIDHLEAARIKYQDDLNPAGEWLITRAIISTSIDLGHAFKNSK